MLDRHRERLFPTGKLKLRVWTDAPPADAEEIQRIMGGSRPKQRKKRSTSMGDELASAAAAEQHGGSGRKGNKKGAGGRARSNSHHDTKNPHHKVHPRSKEAFIVEQNVESGANSSVHRPELWMCRSFFFTGKCDELASRGSGSRKSGGCRHVHSNNHNNSPERSLFQVLHAPTTAQTQPTISISRRQLNLSEQAVKDSDDHQELARLHPGAMEMVFYQEIELDEEASSPHSVSSSTKQDGDDDNEVNDVDPNHGGGGDETPTTTTPPCTLLLSDRVAKTLAGQHLKLSDIAYICVDHVLLYDRYRNGVVYESEDTIGRPRDSSVGGNDGMTSTIDGLEQPSAATARDFPGSILEHILAFLPDEAVAAANRVCRSWYREIGTNHSPSLWKHLLDRHNWPHPPRPSHLNDTPPTGSSRGDAVVGNANHDGSSFRSQFLQHYSVIRDLKAVQRALHAIATGIPTVEREMAYQDFSIRQHAPVSRCVNLFEWSPNRILAGYADDCSLRLFETSAKPGSISGEKVCRELICKRMDPYRNTKRRNCRMLSFGLDEQCIGCLCKVSTPSSSREAFVLSLCSREDLLIGESSEAFNTAGSTDDISTLNVIDIGESVLNYLLSSDEGDHRLFELIEYLSEGNDIGDVEVHVSRKLAACGYGRFMVEGSISIPVEDGDGTVMELIDRRLFLFSASAGAIVWTRESHPLTQQPRPSDEDMILTYLCRPKHPGGSRTSCFIAISSSGSATVMIGEIEASGEGPRFEQVEAAQLLRHEIMRGSEVEIRRNPYNGIRPIVITATDIVVADTVVQMVEGEILRHKTVVSFYPRQALPEQPSYATLLIAGGLDVVRMSTIRDQHVLLVCRRFQLPAAHEAEGGGGLGEIDGHWFGGAAEDTAMTTQTNNDNATENADAVFVVIHVPSRQEISRIGVNTGPEDPHVVEDGAETIGVALNAGGIVMTGKDVRTTNCDAGFVVLDDAPTRSAKKKKKRQPNRGGKKDGFARGMSLRG